MIELPDHPWFLACQFHPELKSKPFAPHPLFVAFIKASLEHQARRATEEKAKPEAGRSRLPSVRGARR